MQPCVWTIASSDSCAGAGIQADLATFHALGARGCSIIASITAQNLQAVHDIYAVSAASIKAQWQALMEECCPEAIKIGLLVNEENILTLASLLQHYSGFVILDPVMVSTSGRIFLNSILIDLLKTKLLPRVDLMTPNVPEVKCLTGFCVNQQNAAAATKVLLQLGVRSVLIKGGHMDGSYAQDFWSNGTEHFWLSSPCLVREEVHGTGCVLSSAIAACYAQGYSIADAIVIAKMYVNQGIRLSTATSSKQRRFIHGIWPQQAEDLPEMLLDGVSLHQENFPRLQSPLGFYPIVDSYAWVEKLLNLGVRTIQLRIKNRSLSEIEQEIAQSILLGKKYQAQLFINDYWQLALKYEAYGVHLGQEDLAQADLQALFQAELRLGISTHSPSEIARAHALRPSYIAFGPVFPTTSKAMAHPAQGTELLAYWVKMLKNYSLVAIGGINLQNVDSVIATGVSSVSVISAVTKSDDVSAVVKEFMRKLEIYIKG